MTIEAGPGDETASGERTGSRRSVRRIVGAVVLSVVVIIGLAGWVFLVPYESAGDAGNGEKLECHSMVHWVHSPEGDRRRAEFEDSCDDARSSRRTTALVIGAAVATLACVVSTWPSRRLTGEELGPIR